MSDPILTGPVPASPPMREEVTHELLAGLLARPGRPAILPTDEQRLVIEAPARPSLVTAGAGSGKTQTMVQRIVWLIAREGADPGGILGLTFTRKAAGELRERVDAAVARLREAGLVEADEAAMPEISTYNAFANRLFTEHALLIGQEPDAVVLDAAGATGLMRRLVLRSDDPQLAELDISVTEIVRRALELARTMRENRVTGEQIAHLVERVTALGELPGRKLRGELVPLKAVTDVIGKLAQLAPLVRLAESYAAEKRRLGVIEFADQIVSAIEVIERAPHIAAELRGRFPHVILDEYQDTSAGQIALLRALFRGHGIMAVGDPKQSIYGWRGASAGNMSRFHEHFGEGGEPLRFQLSVSWRNDRAILRAANVLAAPIPGSEDAPELRARDGAGEGRVRAIFEEHLDAEAAAVAEWLAGQLLDGEGRLRAEAGTPPPSAAILFRTRRAMPVFAEALAERGVPCRIIGLGGLMTTPEVTDLVSILRAACEPEAGSELIRLLAGSHCRLGLADIDAAWAVARRLAARDWRERGAPPGIAEARRASLDHDDQASLAEAIDHIADAPADDALAAALTPQARERIARLARMLRDVRARLGLPLADLVEYAILRAELDIEAAANPRRPGAMANLDAFLDAVLAFQRAQPAALAGDLLAWLQIVADEDGLAEAPQASEPGVVQLLTVHGAKGLEWDLVVIPRMVEGGLPSAPREGDGWLTTQKLPYPLRADADDLPRFEAEGAGTQSEVKTAIEQLKADVRERFEGEERRLAYVAFTRARRQLLLSGSSWRAGVARPSEPSRYLRELAESGIAEHPEPAAGERPEQAERALMPWPRAPFGNEAAEAAVRASADAVLARIAQDEARGAAGANDAGGKVAQGNAGGAAAVHDAGGGAAVGDARRATAAGKAVEGNAGGAAAADDADGATGADEAGGKAGAAMPPALARTIRLLLAERRRREEPAPVELPARLAASGFRDLVTDPRRVADEQRRPMPRRPGRASRIGTMFHAWVEQRYGLAGGAGDLLDAELLEIDDEDRALLGLDEALPEELGALAQMRERFLASPWAARRPVAVERSIQLPLAGRTIVCKIDAVFEREDGGIEIVDWKTGRAPRGEAEEQERQWQLALYTLAYARHEGIDPARIEAVLVYFGEEPHEYRFPRVTGEEELTRLLEEAERRVRGT